jgi:histidinol dehydrogenase
MKWKKLMTTNVRIYRDVDAARQSLLRRAPIDEMKVTPGMAEGMRRIFGRDLTPAEAVAEILATVRRDGDRALFDWMKRIDGMELTALEVSAAERRQAAGEVPADLMEALRFAAERIEAFHRGQHIDSWTDFGPQGALGQIVRPLERVGLYVPAGTAPLPSSLLMSAIPARVAGVDEIMVVTPPGRADGRVSPVTLAAAEIAGVDRVFQLGGAQAIAALAYGAESVPRVDKILGPGNLFVVLAKRMVYGMVDIDGLPGPTETMVIADESARPAVVAADMLAQAEHDRLAAAILLTPSAELAEAVQAEIARQAVTLTRCEMIEGSLANRSGIVVVESLAQAVELANEYAAEHLCLLTAQPWELIGQIRNAGGIFVGEESFEVLGDYVAGPSHIMPTGGTARFASPVNVADFVKITSLIALSREELARLGPAAIRIAEAEGLTAHANAVRARGIELD